MEHIRAKLVDYSKGIFACGFGDLAHPDFDSHHENGDKNYARKTAKKKV